MSAKWGDLSTFPIPRCDVAHDYRAKRDWRLLGRTVCLFVCRTCGHRTVQSWRWR